MTRTVGKKNRGGMKKGYKISRKLKNGKRASRKQIKKYMGGGRYEITAQELLDVCFLEDEKYKETYGKEKDKKFKLYAEHFVNTTCPKLYNGLSTYIEQFYQEFKDANIDDVVDIEKKMNSFEIKLNSDSEYIRIKNKLYSQVFSQKSKAKVWRGGALLSTCATLVLLTAIPCKLMSSNIDNKNWIIRNFSFFVGIPTCIVFSVSMIPFIVIDFVVEEIGSFVINRFVKFEPPLVAIRFTDYILSIPHDDEESVKKQPTAVENLPTAVENQSTAVAISSHPTLVEARTNFNNGDRVEIINNEPEYRGHTGVIIESLIHIPISQVKIDGVEKKHTFSNSDLLLLR
jgi:hypothetical protein